MQNIVIKISCGLRDMDCMILAVAGFKFPHIARFKGVIKIAAAVDTAVILIETAQFPPDRNVITLERFPPGHDAIKIIPKAMDGRGFNTKTSKKVAKGSSINWVKRPITGAFGDLQILLKSSIDRSSATPNIKTPMAIFIVSNPLELKLSFTASIAAASILKPLFFLCDNYRELLLNLIMDL